MSFPLMPHEARSFKSLSQLEVVSMKFSREILQPAETEGNMAELFPLPNLEEASLRRVPDTKYFSSYA